MAKLTTPRFRASFPSVFKPTKIKGSENEFYQLSMIFDLKEIAKDPSEQAKWDAIVDAVDPIAIKKFSTLPAVFKKPFLKGEDMRNKETGAVYDGHEGMVIIRAKSKDRPGVVDQNVAPIMDQSEFYGGCYARATINLYAWNHPSSGKGVSAGLQNVQKVGEGEPFSGKTKAEDDFAPIAKPEGTTEASSAGSTDSGLFD